MNANDRYKTSVRHNNAKAISETARKAIATQTENLDAELYPLLEQVIKELQIATPRRVVTSTDGAGYTFITILPVYILQNYEIFSLIL